MIVASDPTTWPDVAMAAVMSAFAIGFLWVLFR